VAQSRQVDMKDAAAPVTSVQLGARQDIWQDFLAGSANGTLFHDLNFLSYHPPGRFRFHHIMLMQDEKLLALFPGGLVESEKRPLFCSPLGASIGGLVVAAPLRADVTLAMVETLQNYARDHDWAGIQITLPPNYYNFETADTISFALFCRGFRLEHRWLCPVLPLDPKPHAFERMYRQSQASSVRAGMRKGVRCIEAGIESFPEFVTPFRDTYARHGASATHSEQEIQDLLTRFPGRVRIHLAMLEDVPIAALLVFRLNATVAYTFYICSNGKYSKENGPALVIADTMDRLAAAGYRYLDLGPSAWDMKFNKGVTFFKEGLGAVGQCRDRWLWQAQ